MSGIKQRNTAVDLVKLIAILGVVAIHTGSIILTATDVAGVQWTTGLFWGSVFRGSVPLFLMCSGALMLNPEKSFSLKKLYFHNIVRIIAAMLFWGLAYKIYHLAVYDMLDLPNIIYAVKCLLIFDQEFHFYYLHMILLVYAFLPVTRLIVEKADKKLLEYILIMWFLLAIIFPTALHFYPFILLSGMTTQWAINMTYASIGYGILGYYLIKYPPSLKKALLLFAAGFMIVFGLTFYLSVKAGALTETFLQGTSAGVCIMAAGIFSLSHYVKPGKKLSRSVTYISNASFCIYLTHMFVLYILEHFSITAFIMPPVVSIPVLSVCIVAICLIIYAVISRIPIINKWII